VADEYIPGTLNVGHALPTVAQALIYIAVVEVDFMTLSLLIVSAIAGSWIGAEIVTGLPRGAIQRGMGIALLVASVLMAMTALDRFPGGGTALGLSTAKLITACAINFALGALMTLGIGLYAPCMIMISLLGMNPTAAFPIMMGSCAFLMPISGYQFIRKGKYDLRAAMGLAIGGIPGVLIAALIVPVAPAQLRSLARRCRRDLRGDFAAAIVCGQQAAGGSGLGPWFLRRTKDCLVRQRVDQHVDAKRIPRRRELIEERRILAFAFPGIRDVGVVCHQHHRATVFVAYHPEVHHLAVGAPFRGFLSSASPPELDVGDLGNLFHLEQAV
jgi:uncharacterized membrane protein YfcA